MSTSTRARPGLPSHERVAAPRHCCNLLATLIFVLGLAHDEQHPPRRGGGDSNCLGTIPSHRVGRKSRPAYRRDRPPPLQFLWICFQLCRSPPLRRRSILSITCSTSRRSSCVYSLGTPLPPRAGHRLFPDPPRRRHIYTVHHRRRGIAELVPHLRLCRRISPLLRGDCTGRAGSRERYKKRSLPSMGRFKSSEVEVNEACVHQRGEIDVQFPHSNTS